MENTELEQVTDLEIAAGQDTSYGVDRLTLGRQSFNDSDKSNYFES